MKIINAKVYTEAGIFEEKDVYTDGELIAEKSGDDQVLSRIAETVMYLFFTAYGISECIIFIMVKYLRLYVLLWEFSAFLVLTIDDMGDTSLLIRYIVIGILYPFDVGIKRCYDCMD